MKPIVLEDLTDEEVLKEFVKRFGCDGAVLIYLQDESEFGFGSWNNALGRIWVNQIFKRVKQATVLRPSLLRSETGIRKFNGGNQKAAI
ncbi:hypothetical protein [Mucilaginibacter phyllosphaerae]